jgi:allantoicase
VNDFTDLVDLAAARLGGSVLLANDEFFAPRENLLVERSPVFIEDKYTERGKWMDGWETRRRRTPGHDWCIIRLGVPGVISGVVVDTSFFRGNYPESCSIEGCSLAGVPDADALRQADWFELLPEERLQGDTRNEFAVAPNGIVTHIRFNIYPDGGVARLRVHGVVMPDWRRLAKRGQVDLAAVHHGGRVVAASDMFFGHRHNLIMPGRGTHMGDGWETRRRRGAGHDWVVVRLGHEGSIERLLIDTLHFKGNAPGSCTVEACHADVPDDTLPENDWRELLPATPLQPDTLHNFEDELADVGTATHVRFNIFPDGGVSRLRIYGRVT